MNVAAVMERPPAGAGFTTVTEALPAAEMSPDGTAAVSCVLLTKVVVRPTPFHCTTDEGTKLLPITVSVNVGVPASPLDGEREATTGTGLLMVRVRGLEVPPPGVGLNTVTFTEAPSAMSLVEIAAVNLVELTKVVVRPAPFQRTCELEIKLDPVTVSVKAAPPAVALVGEIEVRAGTGF